MTPKEILADFVKDINKRADKVYDSWTMYCDDSSAAADMPPTRCGPNIIRYIEHREWQTKPYRDEGCAAYQLIRFVEKLLPEKIEEIFWRFEPEVEQVKDFDRLEDWFRGYVRFSVF